MPFHSYRARHCCQTPTVRPSPHRTHIPRCHSRSQGAQHHASSAHSGSNRLRRFYPVNTATTACSASANNLPTTNVYRKKSTLVTSVTGRPVKPSQRSPYSTYCYHMVMSMTVTLRLTDKQPSSRRRDRRTGPAHGTRNVFTQKVQYSRSPEDRTI